MRQSVEESRFTILMDDGLQKIYIPGDRVSGKVVLDVPTELKRDSVMLSFVGEARYYYYTSSGGPYAYAQVRHDVHIPFLKFVQVLLPGPVSLAKEKREWSFDFTFPEYFTPFYDEGTVEPLPSSTHDLIGLTTLFPEGGIVYYIRAWCSRSISWRERYKPDKLDAFRNLRFTHPSKQPHDEPETQAIALKRQHWSAGKLPSRIHAVGEKVVKALPKAETHTPCVGFLPTIHVPKAIAPDQKMLLSLTIQLDHCKANETRQYIPRLTLESVSIYVADTWKHKGRRKIGDRFLHREALQIDIPLDDTPASLVTDFKLEDGGELKPSFQFPIGQGCLGRDHLLMVILGIRSFDKTFKIKCQKVLFLVRSKYDPRMAQIPPNLLPAPPTEFHLKTPFAVPWDVLKAKRKERYAARKARVQRKIWRARRGTEIAREQWGIAKAADTP